MPTPVSEADVLAIIYAPLHRYPSSRFQVELLAEAGFRVEVLEYSRPARAGWSPTHLAHESVQLYPLISMGRGNRLLQALDLSRFRRTARRLIRQRRPKVVIAYDTLGCYLAGPVWKTAPGTRLLWHFHELPGLLSGYQLPRMVGRAERFLHDHLARTDALIFPDAGRAGYLSERWSEHGPIHVIPNCPRRRAQVHTRDPTALKARLRIAPERRIVYFQGALSPTRALLETIQSIPHWPENTDFFAIGPVEASYLETLRAEASRLGVAERFYYHPEVPYNEAMEIAAVADLGLCLIHAEDSATWRYSAGAINKRFEYMALGLPQVTSVGAGVEAIIDQRGVGRSVDPASPPAIAQAISELLSDDKLRTEMADAARRTHLEEFNYETVFASLLPQLTEWISSGPPQPSR